MAVLLACITAVLVFLADQASKARALTMTAALSGFIRLRCIVSKGGLVRLGPGPALISAWLLCIVAALAAVLSGALAGNPAAAIGIGMIAGGVSGNFRDLQRRRGVVDFIAVGSFTIFNLADCAIACGIGLAVLAVV